MAGKAKAMDDVATNEAHDTDEASMAVKVDVANKANEADNANEANMVDKAVAAVAANGTNFTRGCCKPISQ